MFELQLPYVNLPAEFLQLLKSNLGTVTSPSQVFDVIRPNKAFYLQLENSFKDLDDGRGLEKTMMALGWHNFRNRVASLYISKALYGHFPIKTDLSLVEGMVELENRFSQQGVQGHSRIFMLAFYLRLAQLKIQLREANKFLELKLPVDSILSIMKVSQGRSVKTDILILSTWHLLVAMGDKQLMEAVVVGKKFDDIYQTIDPNFRRIMMDNLLNFSGSIRESETFLYEKV